MKPGPFFTNAEWSGEVELPHSTNKTIQDSLPVDGDGKIPCNHSLAEAGLKSEADIMYQTAAIMSGQFAGKQS